MPTFNKKIYKSYNFKTRRGVRHKRSQWRQQKLAVGTVKTIARQIAKDEDNKNTQYLYLARNVLANPSSTWDTAYSRPAELDMVELTPNTLYSRIITDASGLSFDENLTTRNEVYAKIFQACLAFQNYSQYDIAVRVSLISVPNTSSITTAEPIPQDQPYTNVKYKGIFKHGIHAYNSSTTVFKPSSSVLATKRFICKATRSIYDVQGATTTDEITLPIKEINLTKSYKSKGYKMNFGSANANRGADDRNVYLCVSTNALNTGATIGLRMWGIAGMKYTVKQPMVKRGN